MLSTKTLEQMEILLRFKNPPRKVAIVGPSGTGKTIVAKEIAKKFNIPLLSYDMSELSVMELEEIEKLKDHKGYLHISNAQVFARFLDTPATPWEVRKRFTKVLQLATEPERRVIFESQLELICLVDKAVDFIVRCTYLDADKIIKVIQSELEIELDESTKERITQELNNKITTRQLMRKLNAIKESGKRTVRTFLVVE